MYFFNRIQTKNNKSVFHLTALATAIATLSMVGCATTAPTTTKTAQKQSAVTSNNASGYLDSQSLDQLEDLLYATDMRAVESNRLLILKHGDLWKRIPLGYKMNVDNIYNSRVIAQRSWFTARQPYLDRLSARASRYLYYTVREAERRGIPTELALLPIIESSYDPAATSSAAAAGMWQFIPSTGKAYGLEQTSTYDGRRDVVSSTQAAYDFLSALYNQFGSWELALAAYNAGPGNVNKAIRRNAEAGLPTDYWSLKLPQETMDYVPRFIAVAQIIKNPSSYGVHLPAIANRPHFREIQLTQPTDLNYVASVTGLERAELYALNPGYRGDVIDYTSSMRLLVPADLNPSIDKKLKAMNVSSQPYTVATTTATPTVINKTIVSTPTAQPQTTVVANNQTTVNTTTNTPLNSSKSLADFASKGNVPTQVNNIPQKSTESPISQAEREKVLADLEKEKVSTSVKAAAVPVDINKLETSQSIAEKTGQGVSKTFSYPEAVANTVNKDSDIAKLNKDKEVVHKNQEVVVVHPKGQRSTYTVKAGDTLKSIADRYGVSWRDIAKWNQIAPEAPLFVGTELYLYDAKPVVTKEAKPETYVVQSGDTLIGVASRFGLTAKQLADYNNLTITSNLLIDQKLNLVAPKVAPKPVATPNKPTNTTSAKDNKAEPKPEVYTVQSGDSLSSVATKFGLTLKQLADFNGLESNSNILIGQKLNLVAPKVAPKPVATQSKATVANTTSAKDTKAEPKPEAYTVQSGDSLTAIATKFGLTLKQLADYNGLDTTSNILVGQKLNLVAPKTEPAKTAPVTAKSTTTTPAKVTKPEPKPEVYTVQSGDSLSSVATKFGLTLKQLADYNGLDTASNILIGQKLNLVAPKVVQAPVSKPVATPAKTIATATKAAPQTKPEVHTVVAGESLTSIAQKYHLQLDYLASLNALERTSQVRIGQKLKLTGEVEKNTKAPTPTPTVKPTTVAPKPVNSSASANTYSYTVKAGESLTAIATREKVALAQLAKLNNIDSTASLKVGQKIVIPKKTINYVVQKGDSLASVAKKYSITPTELATMNNLSVTANLLLGATIQVPNR